ncbi:enoyl-CoA hydratase/isomerase family protein [Elioraea tepida]|uniref:Enoyl-CoA hydratase/isomerase family protein n=1 Tax=Elioraea tepida TaxID=2843330 RepID=A0A975YJV3_9PROT|nr:enoyl-CoA hydratase-related protein [Elioraea tepida]QXM25031.1 enoyl-CoA hydratase/isomerase family protein [Elioraea tepida]
MTETVLVEQHPGWRRLVLNRPERLNAFDRAMQEALHRALDDAEADRSCRAVVLAGSGRAFSAGQDLESVRSEADLGRVLEDGWNPLILRLGRLGVPTVAAVHGIAAGAGVALALACDIVLAARSARFHMAFARIGLIPDSGATWQLPRLIGPARARAISMLAEPVTAEQAEAWGMIWRAVEDEVFGAEAAKLAERLAAGPTAALVATRGAFAAAGTATLEAQLERERDLQRAAGQHPDYAEGVAAFLEKRAPRFGARA